MHNPYAGINWGTISKVSSCSHMHCLNQSDFDRIVNGGVKFVAISNYYPSKPDYPLSTNYTVPSGIIGTVNAEQHNFRIYGALKSGLHINSLGSTFSSGSARGETPIGCDGTAVEGIIPKILNQLKYSDAGGITINHPIWSGLKQNDIEYLLSIDERVLGFEIYNANSQLGDANGEGADPTDLARELVYWDNILSKGIRCFGFCVADHWGQYSSNWTGRNILLVDELTEQKCLMAYRKGCFYGQINNTDLAFTNIGFNGTTLNVSTNNATSIKVIVNGNSTTYNSSSAIQSIPITATYVRVEAHSDDDSIFSNPIMIREHKRTKTDFITKQLLL